MLHSHLLAALMGWGTSSWLLMRIFWLPDPPPPDVLSKWVVVSLAGIAGGILGNVVAHQVSSDPMPGIAASIAGALGLVTVVRAMGRR